jgi:hypothetical protein
VGDHVGIPGVVLLLVVLLLVVLLLVVLLLVFFVTYLVLFFSSLFSLKYRISGVVLLLSFISHKFDGVTFSLFYTSLYSYKN